MVSEHRIPLFDLVSCLSEALDLVSPAVVNHHKQVAYAAVALSSEMGIPASERGALASAGMLHDVGALTLQDRLNLMHFEVDNPRGHCELSHRLLRMFPPLAAAADIVRFHHVPWAEGRGAEFEGHPVPTQGHILHLAARVSVLLNAEQPVLEQVPDVLERLDGQSGRMFHPDILSAFRGLAAKESFWLDMTSLRSASLVRKQIPGEDVELDMAGLMDLASLFRRVIDFRSHFTATHSSGVGSSAATLARLFRMSPRECHLVTVAGYLHDLGKLAVPVEILEKPAKLTPQEFSVMRSHTYHTYRTLEPIPALEYVNTTGAFHHERLDGGGYPFHLRGESLSLSARIMAVADVFTAVTEDRPYRSGMTQAEALAVLHGMASRSSLDADVVDLLESNFEEVDGLRVVAQQSAIREYGQFLHPAGPTG